LTADGTLKIADFGLAKQLDSAESLTHSGAVMGTPGYMAPEQAGGKKKSIGPATDVYALGAILYRLVTGKPPFRGETALETLMQVVSEDPVPPRRIRPEVPAELEAVCLKCLRKEPGERYASAEMLARDLGRFREAAPVNAALVTGYGPEQTDHRSHPIGVTNAGSSNTQRNLAVGSPRKAIWVCKALLAAVGLLAVGVLSLKGARLLWTEVGHFFIRSQFTFPVLLVLCVITLSGFFLWLANLNGIFKWRWSVFTGTVLIELCFGFYGIVA
jgi:serine/threonine protein kinase